MCCNRQLPSLWKLCDGKTTLAKGRSYNLHVAKHPEQWRQQQPQRQQQQQQTTNNDKEAAESMEYSSSLHLTRVSCWETIGSNFCQGHVSEPLATDGLGDKEQIMSLLQQRLLSGKQKKTKTEREKDVGRQTHHNATERPRFLFLSPGQGYFQDQVTAVWKCQN